MNPAVFRVNTKYYSHFEGDKIARAVIDKRIILT